MSLHPIHCGKIGDWRRHHPVAKRIAASLLSCADVLELPRWMVIADARERFGCSDYMARQAVALARKNVGLAA